MTAVAACDCHGCGQVPYYGPYIWAQEACLAVTGAPITTKQGTFRKDEQAAQELAAC